MSLKTPTKGYCLKLLLAAMLALYGCVEPYSAEEIDFEDILVIEATITDQEKQQQIFLSRTFELEIDSIIPEQGAMVQVIGGEEEFNFSEAAPGVYLSNRVFAAVPDTDYRLLITTTGGSTYASDTVVLPQVTQIDDLTAARVVTDDGNEGMGIFVESYDPTGNSRNYRYEYEETYKIVAPDWTPRDLVLPSEGSCQVELVNDEWSVRECFMTNVSNSIIQYSTSDLTEDRVSQFMVRSINKDNYIIGHRYSILVRQYVQSNEAYAFYETLNTLSGQESVFFGAQPGFLQGNITSNENPDEKIIGFFELSSVSETRIFFNYTDFFPDEEPSSYVDSCEPYVPSIVDMSGRCVLSELVSSNAIRFLAEYEPPDTPSTEPVSEGPYLVVPRICGDCSVLGDVESPEFWIE
ncbi:DUF4249 domain-containing protein [Flagellimonas oceanensis]|uniref:DUF4249 domain-containing protein n=1 Tax=Flagellimonas oceanensis TaxID=2499163 RepID=UPI003BAD5CA7|tara:strand:+ start:4536 stop:5759 length:1224 start_codon:yes stop_codon:yes gene_type:complete